MQYSIAALALAAAVQAIPSPQAATGAPSNCMSTYPGTFEITVVNSTDAKRSVEKRQSMALQLTLNNGILKDAKGRIGYIAANHQFQFDNPVQTGTIYASGWAVCPDMTLVLGSDSVFQQCLSGDFYNLYNQKNANQCNPVKIYAMGGSGTASQSSDGQPVQSQQSDGQVTGTPASKPPVTQITDGQVQAPTGKTVTQITDGQIQAPTGKPVTQITDGQIQAPTGKPVTQISDGQIQAPTGRPVTQISDGQIQAPTGRPVTQISDGQIQAPTGRPVTQISDGQIQAPTNGSMITAKPTAARYTGAAAMPTVVRGELFGLAAGVLAIAMF